MSTYSASEASPRGGIGPRSAAGVADALRRVRLAGVGLAASAAWLGFGLSCLGWEDRGDWSRTEGVAIAAFIVAWVPLLGPAARRLPGWGQFGAGFRRRTPWLLVLGLLLTLWEVATAKFAWL